MGNLEAWFGEPDMIVRLDCPATSDIPVVTGELEEGMDIEGEDAKMKKSDSPGRSTPTEGKRDASITLEGRNFSQVIATAITFFICL